MVNRPTGSARPWQRLSLAVCFVLVAALGFTAGLATRGTEAQPMQDPGSLLGQRIGSGEWEVVDLSVATAQNMPAWWPTHPPFFIRGINFYVDQAGPNGSNGWYSFRGPYAAQGYEIDEHTGTQIDCPPHFIPPPNVQMPFASQMGLMTCDKVPLADTMGAAVVLDVRQVLDANTQNGVSAKVSRAWVEQWEAQNGRLQPRDVVMLFSGYDDKYYVPFPDGDRLVYKPLIEKSAPGWVAFEPEAMDLMNERGIRHLVTDAPSFGYVENGQVTHVAGLKYGMTWTEFTVNLGQLPLRGAFYVMATYKVKDQQAGIGRAFAIKPRGMAGIGQMAK